MKRVALLPNLTKRHIKDVCREVRNYLHDLGWQVSVPHKALEELNWADAEINANLGYDLAIVLGGDGTLLHFARQKQWHNTPLLGINLGHLGYLTEIEISDLWCALPEIGSNRYSIEERMMCHVTVKRGNKVLRQSTILNEAVISKGALARMIKLETLVDNQYLETYPADGLIISTPTGSTAYSLSAGGPLVHPGMSLMIVTPIAAHALFARPIIIPASSTIKIIPAAKHDDLHLTLDGQEQIRLQSGDEVEVKEHHDTTKLVRIWQRSFYDVVHKKLRRTDS